MTEAAEFRYENHPLYGQIRQRRRSVQRAGKVIEWWEYDTTFRPRMPPGAVAGEPSRQVYCSVHNVPKFFYVDEERRCVQCGQDFVFAASEQRYWYETLKFNFGSIAVRCRSCRKRQQRTRTLNDRVAAARAAVTRDPNSPTAQLDLAESLILLRRATSRGSLSDAVAAARKARSLWPDTPEADYWEGVAQRLAGRGVLAGQLLTAFMAHPAARQLRRGALVRDAERQLEKLRRMQHDDT